MPGVFFGGCSDAGCNSRQIKGFLCASNRTSDSPAPIAAVCRCLTVDLGQFPCERGIFVSARFGVHVTHGRTTTLTANFIDTLE